jgi:hypothetical protein
MSWHAKVSAIAVVHKLVMAVLVPRPGDYSQVDLKTTCLEALGQIGRHEGLAISARNQQGTLQAGGRGGGRQAADCLSDPCGYAALQCIQTLDPMAIQVLGVTRAGDGTTHPPCRGQLLLRSWQSHPRMHR